MTAPFEGVEVDDIEFPPGKVRCYRAGVSGSAIVLLHGGGLDNAMLSWRHSIPVLAADHRVYVPDLPGQGGSMGWRGRADQRNLEEVLRWLLDAWQLQEATLVGLSLGGSIAIGFTLRHPQRVRGLIPVDSGGLQYRLDKHLLNYLPVRLGFVGPMTATMLQINRDFVRRMLTSKIFAGDRLVPDVEAIIDEVLIEARARGTAFTDWQRESISRTGMKVNHLPHLQHIHCPTMIIHGQKDPIVPVAAAREAAEAIEGCTLRVIPEAGHWPNRQRPTEFNSLLREFVNTNP